MVDAYTLLTDTLRRHADVHDWQVHDVTEHSHQLFLIGERTENERATLLRRYQVQVFNDHPAPATAMEPQENKLQRGSASLRLLPTDIADSTGLRQHLDEAVLMAQLVNNQPYSLPAPPSDGRYPVVKTRDPRLATEPVAVLRDLRDRILAAVGRERDVRLSSAELFVTTREWRFGNSRGIDAQGDETSLFLDAILIAHDATGEAEYHLEIARRRLADLPVEDLLVRFCTYTRASLRVVTPSTYQGPVVISGEALTDLYSPLIFHTSAQAAYQRLARLEPGQPVIAGDALQGEPLTLASNALLPYGNATAPLDGERLPAQRVVLIDQGLCRTRWASQRYADYLGIPATGSFANIEVSGGARSSAELLGAGPLYHIVGFSWLNPDPITGDFVAEIKLGYHLANGQSTPVKGGSLSGNLFDALAAASYSCDLQFAGSYLGPWAIRCETLRIAGA
jgi:predicted Zn-dependent protease